MSENDPVPDDLEPLGRSHSADPADAALARAFDRLYRAAPATSRDEAGWNRLLPDAEALSRRRRAIAGVAAWIAAASWGKRLVIAPIAAVLLVTASYVVPLVSSTQRVPRFEVAAPPGTQVDLTLISGTALRLERGAAKIDQAEPGQTRVTLVEGRLSSTVPRLEQGRSYAVATDDCEVIVHGTRFEVDKDAQETRVTVDEGRVEVRPSYGARRSQFLEAHGKLSVPSRAKHLELLHERVQLLMAAHDCGAPQAELEEFVDLSPSPADASGAQYLLALCSAQRGERARAIALFEAAAAHAVDQIRADNALARAAQLSAEVGSAPGIDAWRRYLVRFPHGLHRQLAEQELARLGAGPR